ncbi:uncharacterized protein LOC103478718 [Poecilia reticulata]|uniref:uncharacterized protein LOC103478718 n=1 Tax=Poecilia reticulata TaxID=8081 RepID=UPI0004A3CB52|nr:PREDICTED: uncharacterized protein LOC103478718 [Poecilia reticulata]
MNGNLKSQNAVRNEAKGSGNATTARTRKSKTAVVKRRKKIAVAAARVRAYEEFEHCENNVEEFEDINYRTNPVFSRDKPCLNPDAASFQPYQSAPEVTINSETSNLAEALASSLSMSRLPVPELTVPLRFTDWKMSFMTLIDRKPIPASEKMFYLRNYLAGEARKAIEGFFYRDTKSEAWKVLQDRYGNAFIIQKAFREKLARCPKINANDSLALREFSDFLQGCKEAIPHVKGLANLNDCEENHKLLKKLPEWIVRKWSRIVVEELDRSGDYPDFKCFTEVLSKEGKIACNPIASPLLGGNFKFPDDRTPNRAKTFNTNAQQKGSSHGTQDTNNCKPKSTCYVCKSEVHSITGCPTFASKSVEDKRTFIHENRLCFGCLRKGNVTKDCKRRHTCNVCRRRHPTCLHEERKERPVETTTDSSTSTEEHASQETHRVVSHTSTQHASATTSIVPVLVSSLQEPHKKILTYAMLDTQSDSTFVLEDVIDRLNVDFHPTKLMA